MYPARITSRWVNLPIASDAFPLSSTIAPRVLQTTVAADEICTMDQKEFRLPSKAVELEPTGDECEEGEPTLMAFV